MKPIDQNLAKDVLAVVDAGLVRGMGYPIPGQMCVEAAVCYALGIPHNDEPPCVHEDVRDFKVKVNDASWSSNVARAKGLRRIAVAQLGSNEIKNGKFWEEVEFLILKHVFPKIATKIYPKFNATRINKAKTRKGVIALMKELRTYLYDQPSLFSDVVMLRMQQLINSCTDGDIPVEDYLLGSFNESERDAILTEIAEHGITVLRKLKSPGVKWLNLC